MYHMLVKLKRMLSIIIIYSLFEPELESKLALVAKWELKLDLLSPAFTLSARACSSIRPSLAAKRFFTPHAPLVMESKELGHAILSFCYCTKGPSEKDAWNATSKAPTSFPSLYLFASHSSRRQTNTRIQNSLDDLCIEWADFLI